MNDPRDNTAPFSTDTKSRKPQYNVANESAAQRGQASAERDILQAPRPTPKATIPAKKPAATSTDAGDTTDGGWLVVGSESSAATAPSTLDANTDPTRPLGPVPRSAPAANAGAATSPELSLNNIAIHDMMYSHSLHFHERIWLHHHGHSTVVSSGLHPEQASLAHASDLTTIELGEPFGPISADSPDSQMFGVGAWADVERPPMQ